MKGKVEETKRGGENIPQNRTDNLADQSYDRFHLPAIAKKNYTKDDLNFGEEREESKKSNMNDSLEDPLKENPDKWPTLEHGSIVPEQRILP